MLVSHKISQTALNENKANGKDFKVIVVYISYKQSVTYQKKLYFAVAAAATLVRERFWSPARLATSPLPNETGLGTG